MCHTLLPQNCLRINSQYSPCPVPVSLWTWQTQTYHPSTFDTICNMLTDYTNFPKFPQPSFQQWHWSPHNMDMNNSSIHGSQFRKEAISYQFIASKSLVIILISVHTCIDVSYFLLCLIDFNTLSNLCDVLFFYNHIWSCPLDYTNFVLFYDVNLLLLTYALSLKLIHFPFFFPPILPCYICQTTRSHITFFSCINFVLLNNFYWHP